MTDTEVEKRAGQKEQDGKSPDSNDEERTVISFSQDDPEDPYNWSSVRSALRSRMSF